MTIGFEWQQFLEFPSLGIASHRTHRIHLTTQMSTQSEHLAISVLPLAHSSTVPWLLFKIVAVVVVAAVMVLI